MSMSKEAITILFRIINFVAIAWIIKYLFEKAGLPMIKEKLAEKLALFKGLEEKHKNLIDQNALVAKEIKDQDKLFEMLNKKINIWNQAREEQKTQNLLIIQAISEYHKKRIETQTQNLHQQKIISEVFPRVIKGTYRQLEQKFEKEQESESFLKDIISHMKNSTQQINKE
ncbi:hypothetical protein ACFLYU_03725 [Candidatus Dependentiae bacterium]